MRAAASASCVTRPLMSSMFEARADNCESGSEAMARVCRSDRLPSDPGSCPVGSGPIKTFGIVYNNLFICNCENPLFFNDSFYK